MDLSRDAQKLLSATYRSYRDKRNAGISKSQAKYFGGSPEIHKQLLPDWLFEDVDDTCRELCRIGFLSVLWADNIAYHVTLTDEAIAYMDNRFKNGAKEIADIISNIIPIPFSSQ